ncbi:hypothetical protein B0H10DRAFT_2203444, partial [Mycena sp. CBHHK59/15]
FDFSFVPRYPGLSWRRRRLFTGISRYIYLPHTIATNLEPATTPQPQALPSPVHSAGVLHKRIDIEVSQGSSQYACKLVQEVITQ